MVLAEEDGGRWSLLSPRRRRATAVDGGRHFAPEGSLSLSVVAEASPSTAHVLRPVPRHADAHWIERNGAALWWRIFSGEPDGQPVSFFSPFFTSVIFFFFLIRDSFGNELGFLFLISFLPEEI
jgi:hypothetical protein